jgi:hypothetical protein
MAEPSEYSPAKLVLYGRKLAVPHLNEMPFLERMMPTPLITYNPQGVFLPEHGLTPDDLTALDPQIANAHDEVLADARLWASGEEVPTDRRPLDAGFIELPERLLAEYRELGPSSEVGRILSRKIDFHSIGAGR